MKNYIKILAKSIFILTLVFSCSIDNDEANDLNQPLNPPAWIIGTWLQTDIGNQGFSTEFKFTNNNVKYLVDGDVLNDFNQYGSNPTSGHSFEQEELTNTNDVYVIRRTHRYNGTIMNDLSWKWIKESNIVIRHELGIPNEPNTNPQIKFYEKE